MTTAKYVTVANELRREVSSGRYGVEGGLPTVAEIAKKYSVAVNTVKVALGRLEGEGLIIQRGTNYYVNNIETTMTQYVPLPTARHRSGYVKTLQLIVERVPEHVASKLDLPESSIFPMRGQIAGEVNGKERPLQLTNRYYFLSLSEAQVQRLRQDPGWDPMWDIKGFLRSRDEVTSRPATTQESSQLDLPNGTSVLSLWEIIRDPEGVLLMAQEITLSPRETLIYEYTFKNEP